MSSLFKQIYRYTHRRKLRHNENFWPHIKISRNEAGHIQRLSYRGEEVKVEDLNNLRSATSGDFTILATGPSIKTLNLHDLSRTSVIGVNGAYHLRDKIKFAYFVIVDRDFIDKKFDVVEEIIDDSELLFFTTLHCLNDILKRVGGLKIKCKLAIIEDLSYKIFCDIVQPNEYASRYNKTKGISLFNTDPPSGFSWDIRVGIFDAATVVYWALQLSVWLGAGRILLAGVDMNNFGSPRFYENEENKQPSQLEMNFNKVIQPAFYHASLELKQKKIKVYNLSLKSGLGEDIFEKATLDVIFKKV